MTTITEILLAVCLTLVLIGATLVVFTATLSKQAVLLSVYGVLLAILFLALQAPDVALSQLAVGTAIVPLIVVLSIRKIASNRERDTGAHDDSAKR